LVSLAIAGYAQYEIVTIASDKVDGIGPCQPSLFISPKSPNIMVASFISEKTMQTSGTRTRQNRIYLSKDFGDTWIKTHEKPLYIYAGHGWSFGDIKISPINENEIYVLGVTLQKSET
jgi:hypothetical protein